MAIITSPHGAQRADGDDLIPAEDLSEAIRNLEPYTPPDNPTFGPLDANDPLADVPIGPYSPEAAAAYSDTQSAALNTSNELAAFMANFGYTPGTPGTPGSPSRSVTDTAALAASQNAIQETLDASLAHIADQFQRLQQELDRQKEAGIAEIETARSQALSSLVALGEDFATQAASVDAKILDSISGTRSAISSDSDSVLRDLEAQGASTQGVLESVQRGQQQAASQGQIQGDLVSRLNEINTNFLGRNEQTTENISQGASGDLSSNFASLLASASAQRADQEFSAGEQARQALLGLILNPPKKTVGGGGGSSGTPAGGLFDQMDTFIGANAIQNSGGNLDAATVAYLLATGQDPIAATQPADPTAGEYLAPYLTPERVETIADEIQWTPDMLVDALRAM